MHDGCSHIDAMSAHREVLQHVWTTLSPPTHQHVGAYQTPSLIDTHTKEDDVKGCTYEHWDMCNIIL